MPPWAKNRVSVRPGLTGLARVRGNALLSWEERCAYDLTYIRLFGFWTDLSILLQTFSVLFLGESRVVSP